ncbi:cilia- and flagella-associated protein 52-like [Lineus longissimus]|uniref:cilia- and flagella-associated protein 52-like n=1 Tax=Lineus longissimus TaxID=88925 RepID=UPI002B4F8745
MNTNGSAKGSRRGQCEQIDDPQPGLQRLELIGAIGFDGDVCGGLLVVQRGKQQSLVYPLGSTIIVADIEGKEPQKFLTGHTQDVTCVAASKDGTRLASGQVTHQGFMADIIIWNLETMCESKRFVLHKVKVEALAFSPNGCYLLSLGGQDDGSVVIWDVNKQTDKKKSNLSAICGHPAQVMSAGNTKCVAYANKTDNIFVTGGDSTLRVWKLDVQSRKMIPTDVNMGQVKRTILCMQMAEDDKTFYCGTTTGDILLINAETHLFQRFVEGKELFQIGVTALKLLSNKDLIIGAGDGTVAVLKEGAKKVCKKTKVNGKITSIALRGKGHQFFVGTDTSHTYKFSFDEFKCELIGTSHYNAVNDIAFARATGSLFTTCAREDVRVWHASNKGIVKELLRIKVANMECNAVEILPKGNGIVTGWDDGKIKCFTPEKGKIMFTIEDGHNLGVTALACMCDPKDATFKLVTGGGDGQVRVWSIMKTYTTSGKETYVSHLDETMKEHKALVSFIKLKRDDMECVSASSDGTCIIWDLVTHVRKQIMFANTLFKGVCYNHQENQVITCGTDRKIGYWDTYNGEIRRELDGSKAGSVNGVDISPCGKYFVSGHEDKMLKVWLYDEGEVTHVGIGHSGPITRVRVCPVGRSIISTSTDGAVLIWRCPNFLH